MKKIILGIMLIGLVFSCSRVGNTAKKAINKSGEVIGKGASEFIEGVKEGVDKTLDCKIILSQKLKNSGIQTGKFSINNDSIDGKNNVLTIYLIFDKKFNGEIIAKVNDKTDLEFGRKKMNIEGEEGEAKYIDFIFDKRTYIEAKSKITIE